MCDFLSTLEASVPSTNPHEYFLRFPTLTAPTFTIVYHTTAPHRPYAQLLTCAMAFKPITISHVFCTVVVVPWCLSAVSKQTTPTDIACRDGTYVDLPQKACSVAPRNETLEHPNRLSAPPLAYPVPYDKSHADAPLYSSQCRQHSVLCSTTRQGVLSIMTVLLSSTTTTGRRALLAISCVDDRKTPSIHRLTFVFLSGLRWQLSGLSELPLKQRLLLLLSCQSSFFIMFSKSHIFLFFAFVGLFKYHVRACCRASNAILQYRKHSAVIPHKAAKQVRADQNATTQASKQESVYVLYCTTASTTQHSASARTKPQRKYVPIRVRRRKQADSVDVSQHVVVHL